MKKKKKSGVRCNLKKPQRRRSVVEKKNRGGEEEARCRSEKSHGGDRRRIAIFASLCVLREFSAK